MTSQKQIMARRVPVNLAAQSYSIEIEAGLTKKVATVLAPWIKDEHLILVSDDVVGPLYLDNVVEQVRTLASRVDTLVVPAGEPSKSVATCDELWQKLVDFRTDRKSIVIALGGGVVGDLTGFVAATFARGLRFIQLPTTLLAQVDSSVGGKVGINLPHSKNMVGAFWQPETVLIDPLVLSTLDDANYRAGLAEVIKYGLIMDPALFEFLEQSVDAINQKHPETLARVIAWCCQCKATVVAEDERETTGRRAILNYGHTYGHAIEAVFGYGEYLHGQAISIGMTCAARLARNLGIVDQVFLDRQSKLFQAVGLPVDCPAERHRELLESMKHDKKVTRGQLVLILPKAIGFVEQVAAPDDVAIRASLQND